MFDFDVVTGPAPAPNRSTEDPVKRSRDDGLAAIGRARDGETVPDADPAVLLPRQARG